jgi:hypothetical protein
MVLSILVVRESLQKNSFWTVDCWDECTLEENPKGFEERLEQLQAEHGQSNVKILKIKIQNGSLEKAFEVPEVNGRVQLTLGRPGLD